MAATAGRIMNRELIIVIDQLGREKGIDKEVLFEALESALLSASRKSLARATTSASTSIGKTGEFRVYPARRWSRRSPIPSSRSAWPRPRR